MLFWNIPQVRLSLLEKAGLGSNLTAGDVKYLINYFLLGKNIIGRYMKNLINICLLGKNMIIRSVKYIINFSDLAMDTLCRQPDNWEAKLAEIQRKLKWDPEHLPFANVSAQVGISGTQGRG